MTDPTLAGHRPNRLSLNLIANFVGTLYTALIGLAVIPFYIRMMGIEAYGLIGFYLTMQGTLQILDFGLSPTLNRELARYSTLPDQGPVARDLVRTLEVGYWLLGAVLGGVIVMLAPTIASHWINASALPPAVTVGAVRLMGVLIFMQWPLSFYQGGMIGLQRQIRLNFIVISMSTLRNGGALLVLAYVSRDVTVFFTWQIIIAAVQVAVTTASLWQALPASGTPARFKPARLRSIWKFAAGMSGIAISGLILTQLDKVILSTLLPLESFGYYTLAGVVASSLYMLISLVFNAVFPRLTALLAANDQTGVTQLYHLASQLMTVLIWPVVAVAIGLAPQLLRGWTGDAHIAGQTAPIVRLLLVGAALNGMMHLPYALQLASGWTSLNLRLNGLLLVLLVPALFLAVYRWGATGAAGVWAGLNMLYLLIGVPLTHRRLLIGEAGRWFVRDLALPLAGVLAVTLAGAQLLNDSALQSESWPGWAVMLSAGLLGLAALGAAVGLAPELRRQLVQPAGWLVDWIRAGRASHGS